MRGVLSRLMISIRPTKAPLPCGTSIKNAEVFDKAFDGTEIFLAAVALITLTLGGVGVMNTMMTAVAERTHEIGLRMALGATKRRVLTDFLLEGLLLAFASGALGMGVVSLLAAGVNSLPMPEMFSGLPDQLPERGLRDAGVWGRWPWSPRLPPALRACQLTPVEALREER